jgi:integrase/recombinase XerD
VKDPTCHALASTLYGAGLRIEEARRLEITDVLSNRGLLHVRHGKGAVERFAMLSERLLHILREYWRVVRPTPPKLFPSRHSDGAIAPGTVRIALRRAAAEFGIAKNVTPHVLRHSFATHMLELGVEMRVIQQLLGHSSIRTTMRYTHVSREHIARITSPLDLLGTPAAEILR